MNRRLWDRAARGVGSRVWYLFLLGFFWGWGGLGELWGGGGRGRGLFRGWADKGGVRGGGLGDWNFLLGGG